MQYYFKDEGHRGRFAKIMQDNQPGQNRRLISVVYLLALFSLLLEYLAWPTVDFQGIFSRTDAWSSGEKSLIKLAAHLYDSARYSANIDEVFYILDADNVKVALQALRIRY